MLYVSTRGETPAMSFQNAVLTGQAPDGGLLLPQALPSLSCHFDDWRSLSFPELALEVLDIFAGDIPREDLTRIVKDAYGTFGHDEVVVLKAVGSLNVLELFHGPTLAFKDVALQVLGRLFEHVLTERNGHLNVLGATSGDTGSAAIAGVRGRSNIDIFILYPNGRVSPRQELQMTTVTDANVHCIAIDGSFDDCQRIMKAIFNDLEFKARLNLGAVNSVNWARLLTQMVYYFYSALRFEEPVVFSVPTGNFGDIFAGYLAREMGAPIKKLILASNENDILARFFETGIYELGRVHHTISPSMDIQVASNFERFIYYRLGGDCDALNAFMECFESHGSACISEDGPMDEHILATAVDQRATIETISEIYAGHGYLVDPHTAVGIAAAKRFPTDSPVVCFATAHPAKFPEAVNAAVGRDVAHHPTLDALDSLRERKTELAADINEVKNFISANAAT
jgi:threonine synthase